MALDRKPPTARTPLSTPVVTAPTLPMAWKYAICRETRGGAQYKKAGPRESVCHNTRQEMQGRYRLVGHAIKLMSGTHRVH